jgi:branched-chain amino acid transport system substrate-binding protein
MQNKGGPTVKWRKMLAVMAAGALVVVAAACSESDSGDDSSDDTSSQEEPSTRTTRGVTDDTIKVGAIATEAIYGPIGTGFQARLDRANREGELPGGRQFEYVGLVDDLQTDAGNLAAAQELVEEDEVFAVAMQSAQSSSVDYLGEQTVPLVGWAIGPQWCGAENAFGFSGGCLTPTDPQFASDAIGVLVNEKLGGDAEGATVAIIADDNDLGRSGITTQTASFESAGFDVVYAEPRVPAPPAPAPSDYSPFVNELLTSSDGDAPDVIYLLTSPNNTLAMAQSLKDQNYEGEILNAIAYDYRLTSTAEGTNVYIQFAAFETAPENEYMEQMINDLERTDPELQLPLQTAAAGYFSAELLIRVLQEVGEDVTAERFIQIANDDFEFGIPDTLGDITYPDAHNQGAPCGSLVEYAGTEFEVAVPFQCGELIEL